MEQPAKPVKPTVNAVSSAHKGLAMWSVHSTNSEAALKAASPFIMWDFHAPVRSKLQSVLGLASVYDTGQLTSSAVVMRHSVFEKHLGLDWIRLPGSERDKVASADSSSMVAVGSVTLYLSVAGLPALSPIPAKVTLCNSIEPDFLVGKILQDQWDWSIHIKDGRERWQAGGDSVATLTTAEAALFNAGIPEQGQAGYHPQLAGQVSVNLNQCKTTVYPARDCDPPIQQMSHPPNPPSGTSSSSSVGSTVPRLQTQKYGKRRVPTEDSLFSEQPEPAGYHRAYFRAAIS